MTDKDVPANESIESTDEQDVEDREEEQSEAPPPAEEAERRDGRNGGWQPPPYPPPPGHPPSAYPLTYDHNSPAYAAYRPAGPYPPGPPPGWPYPGYYYMTPSGPMLYPHYVPAPPQPATPRSANDPAPDAESSGAQATEEKSAQPQRPPKAYIACHYCRMRKIRCDGNRPECSTCARYGQVQCTYDTDRRKRGPAKNKKSDRIAIEQPSQPIQPIQQQTLDHEAQIRAQRLIEELRRQDSIQSTRPDTTSDTALTAAAIMNALPALAAGLARLPAYQWATPTGPPAVETSASPAQNASGPASSALVNTTAAPASASEHAPLAAAKPRPKAGTKGKGKEDNSPGKLIQPAPQPAPSSNTVIAISAPVEVTRSPAKGKRKKDEGEAASAEQAPRKRARKAAAETAK